MKAHPEIGRCAIEGHTDDTGPPEWNQKLSVLRAAAVIEFLGAKGVDPKRLVPMGHGEDLPWASNETPEGRAKNRRVVFHIEGVNPAGEKKEEQRNERRRRIRRRQQQQQQQQEAPPLKDTLPERRTAPAAEPPKESTPPTDRVGKPAEKVPDRPANEPVEHKKTAAAPRPVHSPPHPPSGPIVAPAPTTPVTDDDKTANENSVGKPAGRAAAPRAPSRTAPKRSPDAGAGPPPSLRDLLKLPPR
jgi:outer membrane biosynthesis protein TonB